MNRRVPSGVTSLSRAFELSLVPFRLIASTPPAKLDPAIAIAAARAGDLGILDLSEATDAELALAAAGQMSAVARGNCGVRLDAGLEEPAHTVAARLPADIKTVILRPGGPAETAELAEVLLRRGTALILEVVATEQLAAHDGLSLAGVVAKGSEAGGWVGEETAFVLVQRVLAATKLPVYAQGGIGVRTAAACVQAGAAGAVLDGQLLLVRESPLSEDARAVLVRFDGGETATVGAALGASVRIHAPAHSPGVTELRALAESLDGGQAGGRWRLAVRERLGWEPGAVWPTGQDVAFAGPLADRHLTTGRVLRAIRAAVDEDLADVRRLRSLAAGAPLARSLGTRYPIVQGPMTRVSDSPAFAEAVAREGALPVLALALMRGGEVGRLLRETRDLLGDRPWGAGVLGFVEQELRREQIDAIRECPPDFAILAGGRPDQSLELEQHGIATFLHTPSPALLELYARAGARRFIWEGRECGGHVGPRSSFVLWSQMTDMLLRTVPRAELVDFEILFAGGIGDARSAAMVATLAVPLARAGVRVGVLLGTAYLFTRELVESGAVVPAFQAMALECTGTSLLESGPGHAIRCARSPYVGTFDEERARLQKEGRSDVEIRDSLEALNVGRLRAASKGLAQASGERPGLVPLPEPEQREKGMYMLGQIAALHDRTRSVADLHDDVSRLGTERLLEPAAAAPARARPFDVAIVGMGCLLPGASSAEAYWRNILTGVDAVREVPTERFNLDRYFDADPAARDRISSRWGGFLDEIEFDPLRWGMPPSSLPSIEPLQLLVLEAARQALDDAGYLDRSFARERTSVILGLGGGVADLGHRYAVRSGLPELLEEVPEAVLARLPEWTEDSFPGILLNVVAGRVANRFDLGGVNYAVDAACASSLTAIQLACRELQEGTSEMVLAGGGDTVQNAFGYTCFTKTHALSPTGRCRPFDAAADGIAISEGVAVLALKRLADAERDGDRVHAVIKAVAGSSDGRARGLTAPRPEGQALALRRAYAQAGVSPAQVGLVEAHGTGTVAGDRAEVETLRAVFEASGAEPRACAVGSVKSMIGHTKCTAGVAGLMKAALALRHRVLPPTLHVERPNAEARFGESPFHVNTELRPWIADGGRRVAGVSAFGFGGTNFHAVLEEYEAAYCVEDALTPEWPAELVLWAARSRAELLAAIEPVARALDRGADVRLADLARTTWAAARGGGARRLAVVATSLEDLSAKLATARAGLEAGEPAIEDPRGVYFSDRPLAGRLALVFPGQGSQSCGMLRELAVHFGEVRERFEVAGRVLGEPIGRAIFPPPAFEAEERAEQEAALRATEVAQPALGAADLGMARLLEGAGVRPDAVAGHSYGEYVALAVAGALTEEELVRLSRARGRAMIEAAGDDPGTMAAVAAGADRVEALLDGIPGVVLANRNAPRQTVISGPRDAVGAATERLEAQDVPVRPLPVACAFHSPLVASARDLLATALAEVRFARPRVPVYANALASPYPNEPAAVAGVLSEHLVQPVRWAETIEAMYRDGVRIFVEAGPQRVLTGLGEQILGDRPHLCVAAAGRPAGGLAGLQHALARLAAHGVPVDLEVLHRGRGLQALQLDDAGPAPAPGPTTWMVSGGRVRPAHEPVSIPHANANGAGSATMTTLRAEAPETTNGAGPPGDIRGEALVGHQLVMQRFLETQQAVMLAFLGTEGAVTPAPSPVAPPPEPVGLLPAAAPPVPEVATPAAPPVPAAPATAPAPTAAGDLRTTLLELVSERTGYPPEMLDLDVNVEAELGLDSIKFVEIVGAFQHIALPEESRQDAEAMEQMAREKTLRAVLDTVGELAGQASNGAGPANGASPRERRTPATSHAAGEDADGEGDDAPRCVPVPEALPDLPEPAAGELADPVLMVGDGRVGPALAGVLTRLGVATVALDVSDLADDDAAAARVDSARESGGRIAAVVHLSALRACPPVEALDSAEWGARLREDVQGLGRLLRAAADDLRDGGRVLGATALGGTFALDPSRRDFAPSAGGVPALLKTVALEWPGAHVKAVDLDPALEPAEAARVLAQELAAGDGEPEVARDADRRTAPRLRPAPADAPAPAALEPGAVVLVTGGARGITAEIACELAERHAPTLVLVGRSPRPEGDEPAATLGLPDGPELRSALLAQRRRDGLSASPPDVERACRATLAAREVGRTLARLRAAGSEARYVQLDVRDPAALAGLVAAIYDRHGRLDGVVHGAGVIEDRRVEDKDAASFERVLATKATSAFVLARSLRPEGLRFLVFFSSIAARLGNPGQADYAAANGVLQKLAAYLDRRWPARVVAIDWAPWAEVGMAAGGVADVLAARGLPALAPAAGRRAFERELRAGAGPEVVLGRGPWVREPVPA